MATPHIAGAMALLWSARPDLRRNISNSRTVLNEAAFFLAYKQCGTPGPPNNVVGWGRVDVSAAVPAPSPNPSCSPFPERTGIENDWYALTSRVVAVKVEADDDLHSAIQDATGDKPGLSFAKDRLDRSGVNIFSENVQFCAATRFCFRRQPVPRRAFPGCFFRSARRQARTCRHAVTGVISAAIGRPRCPIRSIQTERAGPRSQMRQPVRETAPLSPAKNNRRSRPSSHRQAGHRNSPNPGARYCPRRK